MTEQAIQRTLDETTDFVHRQFLLKELWRLHRERELELALESEGRVSGDRDKQVGRAASMESRAAGPAKPTS